MSFRVNLWPLALIFLRDPASKDRWGRARGPVIVMPQNYPAHMLPHELMHVVQWWWVTVFSALALLGLAYMVPVIPWQIVGLSIGVMGILLTISKRFKLRVEAAGYGASVRVVGFRLENWGGFARALSQSYGLNKTVSECRAAIYKRARDGRAF